jgi:NADH-quinone oxidoreductase subunit E
MSDTTVEFSPVAAPLAATLLEPALEILARYPAGRERSALLPLLHLVQTAEGYVTPRGVAFCAEILGINKAQVGAVATFYTMYKRRPAGDYLISVCTNTLCNVMGGQQVYDELSEHLGVGHDQTTGDGKITLEHAECLAACDYAPVVTVNYDFAIDQATPESAIGMVEQLRKGERPMPSRGGQICSLKEMQLQLAGFADPREESVAAGPAGPPTLRGVTLAQEHGIAVADFNLDTPITKTKPVRDEAARPVKDTPEQPAAAKQDGKVVTVAKKAAGAVKAAAGAVADAVEHRTSHAGKPTEAGDVKDPEVRAAESRNPDASTPAPGATSAGLPDDAPTASSPAEAAGVADNLPAGDGKPAGDTERGESLVGDDTDDAGDGRTAKDNPAWTGAKHANEEKK